MALIGNKGDTPDEQVDTIKEFHEAEQKLLWKQDPMQALKYEACLLYTSPSPRDLSTSRMPSSA